MATNRNLAVITIVLLYHIFCVCRTEYETVCTTSQKVHEVEEDVASCETQVMTKCREVAQGYQTKEECEDWPVQRCTVNTEKRKKYTPDTKCVKEPREICSEDGCGWKNVSFIRSDDQ